jgi:polyisoprenoid-binding protein YceI
MTRGDVPARDKVPATAGTVVIDRSARSGTVDVEFKPVEVTTGVPKFDEHLRSADFFEVEKHPVATFKASRIDFEGTSRSR